MQRKHSLPVGSASVIGQVTSKGEPVIARADSPGSVHRANQYLPDTQVEAAFPLRIGGVVIGSLDLQSKLLIAFQETEIPIFQALADSIAIAIDNARLFEQSERRIVENQRLVEQSREALREVERLNRELTKSAWEEYLKTKNEGMSLAVDFGENTAEPSQEWTPSLVQAIRYNHVIQEKQKGGQVIAVPLRVRGQVVGAMEFELDGEHNFSPEDLDLVQEVGERFGLAVENTRLYEESQRIAQREALVNSISARLQTSNSVETIMAEAARGLQQTLKVSKVAIRLGSPETDSNNAAASNDGAGKGKSS
jgi:GAF domain-containing protein